jgi:hypothetical protein
MSTTQEINDTIQDEVEISREIIHINSLVDKIVKGYPVYRNNGQLSTPFDPTKFPSCNIILPDDSMSLVTSPEPYSASNIKVIIWFPEMFWGNFLSTPKCLECERVMQSKGWLPYVRKVHSLGEPYYVKGKVWRCNNCKKTYTSYDSRIMKRYPAFVQERLPVIFCHKSAVDLDLFNLMKELLVNGCPFETIVPTFSKVMSLKQLRLLHSYIDHITFPYTKPGKQFMTPLNPSSATTYYDHQKYVHGPSINSDDLQTELKKLNTHVEFLKEIINSKCTLFNLVNPILNNKVITHNDDSSVASSFASCESDIPSDLSRISTSDEFIARASPKRQRISPMAAQNSLDHLRNTGRNFNIVRDDMEAKRPNKSEESILAWTANKYLFETILCQHNSQHIQSLTRTPTVNFMYPPLPTPKIAIPSLVVHNCEPKRSGKGCPGREKKCTICREPVNSLSHAYGCPNKK